MALYLDGQKIISGGSGSGGHTIVDNEGVSLEQRTNLQFNGAYSEDNSTNDTTEVNIVREMTKAEFDELTEAEKTGLINITDITSDNDNRFQPVIYSAEEREIGVWTDGKPLYEKVFTMSQITVSSSWVNTDIDTTDIDTIASAFGIAPDGTFYSGLDGDPTTSSHTVLSLRSYATSYIVSLILQYTKISDTAGSGQWTPHGVPAHHYSENEQVVGTWVDGKTLYEKTIIITNAGKDANYDLGITDFDTFFVYGGLFGTSTIPYLHGSYPDNSIGGFLDNTGSSLAWAFRSGSQVPATISGFITVRYTKTST